MPAGPSTDAVSQFESSNPASAHPVILLAGVEYFRIPKLDAHARQVPLPRFGGLYPPRIIRSKTHHAAIVQLNSISAKNPPRPKHVGKSPLAIMMDQRSDDVETRYQMPCDIP